MISLLHNKSSYIVSQIYLSFLMVFSPLRQYFPLALLLISYCTRWLPIIIIYSQQDSMILLKNTLNKVKDGLLSTKTLSQMQNNFVFHLVFLSAIKDYLATIAVPEKNFIIPHRLNSTHKKVLVLDMDETLVHTRSATKPSHGNYIRVPYEGEDMYVEKRPFLFEFLEAVNQIFDVWVYTAGNKKYADAVLNSVDPKGKLIQRRFYRDTCRKADGVFYKDLKHLKKVSKVNADMILVDDNKVSIGHNYPFAIQIEEFEGRQQDSALIDLFAKLLKFYGQQ